MKIKKLRIALLSATLVSTPFSTASSEAFDPEGFFNDIGVYGNASAPAMFKGQTRNYITGGSLNMRVPNKSYQLATFDPPRIGASCSGIDLYGGSFSFINSDQLVEMLQNIGNNAAGAIFQLALESVSPQLSATIKFFQDMANKINALNVNSCQASTGIVTAAKEGTLDKQLDEGLKSISTSVTGLADDWSGAWEKISEPAPTSGADSGQANALETALNSSNLSEDQKMWLKPGNLLWKAMGKLKADGANLSDDEKKVIQALVGTVIITNKKDSDGDIKPRSEYLNPIHPFPVQTIMGQDPTSDVEINVYQCKSGVSDCGEITAGTFDTVTLPSFRRLVNNKIQNVRDKVHAKSDVLTSTDFEVVNMSFLPIWTMIENEYRTNGALNVLDSSEEIIALAYTRELLSQLLRGVNLSLEAFRANPENTGIVANVDRIKENIRNVRERVNIEFNDNIVKYQAFLAAQQALHMQSLQVREVTAKQLMMANQSAR